MKRHWPIPVLILLAGLAIWIHLANAPERRHAPPSMTSEQILACPETQVVSLVTTDLRWKLAELDAAEFGRWRTLPAPARHILALAWVERDDAPGTPPIFQGFASLLANTVANMATLAEIAEAYDAIGAPAAAAVVTQAAQLAATTDKPAAAHADPFAALNRQLLSQSSKAGVIRLLRAYVRSNAEVIAAAQIDG